MYKLIQHGQVGDLYYADTNGLEEIVAQENLRFGDRIYCISTNVTYNVGADEQLHAEGGKTVNFPSIEESLARIADALYDTSDDTPTTMPVPVVEFVDDGNSMVAILPDEIKTNGGNGFCVIKASSPSDEDVYMAGCFIYSQEAGEGAVGYMKIDGFGSEVESVYTSQTYINLMLLRQRVDAAGTIDAVPLIPADDGDNTQGIDWHTPAY